MNKSLLVALAIMPTLLVGCKSNNEVQAIEFDLPEIPFNSSCLSKDVILSPKPSSAKIVYADIKWVSETEMETYGITHKQKTTTPTKDGGVVITFEADQSKIVDLKKGIEVRAIYHGKEDRLAITYSN